jgi:hypothetical protein
MYLAVQLLATRWLVVAQVVRHLTNSVTVDRGATRKVCVGSNASQGAVLELRGIAAPDLDARSDTFDAMRSTSEFG